MAVTSRRLKGMYVRNFKKAATGLEDAVHILAGRMDSGEEVKRLDSLNKKLSKQVAELRSQSRT